jgi:hypothetical protein
VEVQLLFPIKTFVEDAQAKQIIKASPPEVLIAIVWGAFVGLISAARKGYLELDDGALGHAENCLWEAIRR